MSVEEVPPKDPVAVALGILMSARASLDAAIDVLSKVSRKPPEPTPIKDANGNCLHTHRKPLSTMGGGESMDVCTDCDAIVPSAA